MFANLFNEFRGKGFSQSSVDFGVGRRTDHKTAKPTLGAVQLAVQLTDEFQNLPVKWKRKAQNPSLCSDDDSTRLTHTMHDARLSPSLSSLNAMIFLLGVVPGTQSPSLGPTVLGRGER
jgi:hypothetical protein